MKGLDVDVIEMEEKLLLTGKLFASKIHLNKNDTRSPANTFALQSHIEIQIQVSFKFKTISVTSSTTPVIVENS